jgi:hypothetical protein
MLGRLENVGSSSVDSTLYLFQRWLQGARVNVKMNINLEEWLKDLLGHVSSSTNSLFHLVERVLGGV